MWIARRPKHPRKGQHLAGQAARGSGALAAFADILLEMNWYRSPADGNRRRRLRGFSRHEETPRLLVLELTADGTDYLVHPEVDDEEVGEGWHAVQLVLEDAVTKMTRQELLEQWPTDYPQPAEATLWRLLDRAVKEGWLRQEGSGKKCNPFRYWLPGREEMLRPEPGASAAEMQAWNKRVMQEFWQGDK